MGKKNEKGGQECKGKLREIYLYSFIYFIMENSTAGISPLILQNFHFEDKFSFF